MSRERRIELAASVVLLAVLFGIWAVVVIVAGKVAAALVSYALAAVVLWRMRQLLALLDRL